MLKADKRETVRIPYDMYRRRFSITACPATVTKDKSTNKPLFADINRLQAINYLMAAHDFKTMHEVKDILNDAATDICGTVQGVSETECN